MQLQQFRSNRTLLHFCILFLPIIFFFNTDLHANSFGIGQYWPTWNEYENMDCAKLSFEYSMMRKDLENLQRPTHFNNKKWNEARNRYFFIIQLYESRCRRLTAAEKEIPTPPNQSLPSEEIIVKTSKQAIKQGRYEAAEKLLLQGSKAGYPDAQYNLGMWYIVIGKKEEGKKWLRSASSKGHKKAQEAIQSLK